MHYSKLDGVGCLSYHRHRGLTHAALSENEQLGAANRAGCHLHDLDAIAVAVVWELSVVCCTGDRRVRVIDSYQAKAITGLFPTRVA